jgi:predicted RNA methylase
MLYGAELAVCYEIDTKHINTFGQNIKFLNLLPVGARNQ